MRKRPVSRNWLFAAGIVAVIVVLSWVQFSIKSLGNELDQTRSDNAALAAQVRSLGGQPVAEPKPGSRGDAGPQGPQGIQGPPGIQGPRGPIGITGQSPACLLEPTRCVGPKGANGQNGSNGKSGQDGTQGSKGDPGTAGAKGDQGIPGVAGKDGAPGKDGVDGQPGADGKDGARGADGKDGRGVESVTCQSDGTWLVTYTDGKTSDPGGTCRAAGLLGN